MGVGVFPWRCICGPKQSFSKSRSASASAPSPLGKRSKYSGQSVKAMPMRLLTVGKKRSRGTQLLVEEYKEKLGYYCDFEDTLIRSNPKLTSDVKVQVEAEDAAMMQQLKSDDFVVVLDENGKDAISEQIADLIGDAGNTGSSRLTFCIGGPYGLGVQVRERADATIRLSSLVLNHQVALIVLMEQLYRYCINLQGMDYNKRTEVSPLGYALSSSFAAVCRTWEMEESACMNLQLPAHSMDTVNKMKFCWVLYWLLGGYERLRASSCKQERPRAAFTKEYKLTATKVLQKRTAHLNILPREWLRSCMSYDLVPLGSEKKMSIENRDFFNQIMM